ncbi:MAG TPA: TIGR00366 family protein [Chthoniobacterales bacterium]|nr:TIGR00366 family protein [Chthoniobacterales bacterium]
MEGWKSGRVEGWKDGRVEGWKDGGRMEESLFVPSAGGHWAVQGPFTVPAAVGLHASQAATGMGVAYGEQVADMIQPFRALPVVAVGGISIRRVMGFTVMSFLLDVVLFGTALLIFV